MKIFCGAEKFRSEMRLKTRPNPQAASWRCSADLVGTCWSAAEVGRRPAGLILARSRTISDDNCLRHREDSKFFEFFFQCRKNFHPKSCEIAPKSARPDDSRPLRHYNRSSQGRLSTGTMRRAGVVAFSNAFRTENFRIFFGAAKIFVRNRARSRRNQRDRTTADLRSTPAGPHKVS